MRIHEGEGLVLSHRDALAGRLQAQCGAHRRLQQRRPCGCADRLEVDGTLESIGECLQPALEVGGLTGLYQTEMTLGQCQRVVVADRAKQF